MINFFITVESVQYASAIAVMPIATLHNAKMFSVKKPLWVSKLLTQFAASVSGRIRTFAMVSSLNCSVSHPYNIIVFLDTREFPRASDGNAHLHRKWTNSVLLKSFHFMTTANPGNSFM